MISPIFDLVFLYNHITTLLRVMCLLCFLLGVLFFYRESLKKVKWLIAYYLAVIGYLLISHVHSRGFISLVPGDFNYSFISEAMTLLKLCMPFTILFILKYLKYDKKNFFKVINCWILIIGGSIVICNICGFSLSSYSDAITHYSIFSWGKGLSVLDTATKGWFSYANQEVLILLMLLALSIYEYFVKYLKSPILVIVVSLALLMLGTRIGTYGGLLVLIFMLISYLFFILLVERKKMTMRLGVLLILGVVWFMILPYTPCSMRVNEIREASTNVNKNSSKKEKKVEQKEVTETPILSDFEIFEHNINKNLIGEQFYLDFYPYEYDKEFWNNILDKQNDMTINYRVLELMIVRRVIEIDGRTSDHFLGITNSRLQNIVNIEQDFLLHYYAYGIIGMFITLLFYGYSSVGLVKCVLMKKKFIDFVLLVCFVLFVLGAIVSGNNVNFLAGVVPLAFIVSGKGCLEEK